MLEVEYSDAVDAVRFVTNLSQELDVVVVTEYPEEVDSVVFLDEMENKLRINDTDYGWGYLSEEWPENGIEYGMGFYVSYYPSTITVKDRTLSKVSTAVSDFEEFSQSVKENTNRRDIGYLTLD